MNTSHLPKLSVAFATILNPLHRIFDRIYHSKYNPLYKSGVLACFFLLILLVTGIYLLFFYSVGAPYQSIENIQQQIFGQWLRAIHRYATGGVLIAVFFHILQMVAHGKTWGPRLVAWLSGLFLLSALFLSAWTGYVMVWDSHGQLLAQVGTEMLKSISILHDSLALGFNGTTPIPSSFFFMNLFLHIAIPLLMIFGLWVHTAKLSRNSWFPSKEVSYTILLGLGLTAAVIPAPLLPEANLLTLVGETRIDWFTGFWIPIVTDVSPASGLLFWIIALLLGISVPFWFKPAKQNQLSPSKVDPEECTGCMQCVRDCPFDAITMIPHPQGKRMLAKVAEDSCVSCGICAASCVDLAIGPEGRNGHDLIAATQNHISTLTANNKIVVICCLKNSGLSSKLKTKCGDDSYFSYLETNCAGTVHTTALENLLKHCSAVAIVGCPINNCHNRGGAMLLRERLYDRRVPFLDRTIDRRRVLMLTNSDSEFSEVASTLDEFHKTIQNLSEPSSKINLPSQKLNILARSLIATLILFFAIAKLSQIEFGETPQSGQLRISARVPGKIQTGCHSPTPDERSGKLAHMQQLEVCTASAIRYQLEIFNDNSTIFNRSYSIEEGTKDNRFLLINEDLPIAVGTHRITVKLTADNTNEAFPAIAPFEQEIRFNKGEIAIIRKTTGDRPQLELIAKKSS